MIQTFVVQKTGVYDYDVVINLERAYYPSYYFDLWLQPINIWEKQVDWVQNYEFSLY